MADRTRTGLWGRPPRPPRPPRPRGRRRRGALAGTLVAACALGSTGAGAAAAAQADDATSRLLEQFGGFELSARGNGLQLTYDSPGLVPIGPAVQVSVPEALATSSSGTNYALASLAYPGPVLANLSTVLAQSNPDAPPVVPPYPIRAEAFFPSGPTDQAQSAGTAEMRAATDAASSRATASSSATDVAQLVGAGSLTSATRTQVEAGRVTSRARVEASGTDILGGLLHVESVVTDLVAVSDGRTAGTDGETTVGGVTFLGLAATIDRDGLRLVEQPPSTGDPPGPLDPVVGPLLGSGPPPVAGPSRPLREQLNRLVTSTVGAGATLGDLLEENGVRVRVLDPVEAVDGGTGTRSAYGLQVELSYTASGDPRVAPLLAQLAPSGRLPAECPVPDAPLDCSPEGLVALLTRTQISAIGVGAADVKAAATAPFDLLEVPFSPGPSPDGAAGVGAGAVGPPAAAAFTTPAPALGGDGGIGSAVASALAGLGRALPAALVLLVVLTAPLWAAGSRRLADAALAGGSGTCPDGLDQPPPSGRCPGA